MSNQSIEFMGAARTVTGSKHLLTINGKKILVDCGLYQGSRELSDKNRDPFLFDPAELDAVIVTHAHTDHIGLLPKLIREGYTGKFYATPATIGIAQVSLPDSGRLQEEDARHRQKRGLADWEPLYTEDEAYRTLGHFLPLHYYQMQSLPGHAQFRFIPAGHIFGSGMAEIYFENGERILMGGDLGRFDAALIRDPAMVDFSEYLVLESTYGDRFHAQENVEEVLQGIFEDAFAHSRVILVPSFAIGRTQEMLYHITNLQRKGVMPRIPIYVDSPMAVAATKIYDRTKEDQDPDFKQLEEDGFNPLEPANLTLVRDSNQSKELNSRPGPFMVIAGSGMANGGRILHHLKHRLADPNTVVLFTGYQANGTLGRRILEGEQEVNILGDEIPVNAEVNKLNSLSAHADQGEIMRWLKGFKTPPKKTFLVHGEPTAMETLAEKIKSDLGWHVEMPVEGQVFQL